MTAIVDSAEDVPVSKQDQQKVSLPDSPPFDESLLVRVKGKVKKPVKPDEAERNVPVAKLQVEIAKYGDRITELKDIIDSKRSAGRSTGAGGGDSRNRMQSHRNDFQNILRQKQRIRDEMTAVTKQREMLRTETRAIRDKVRIVPEAELDQRIAQLEFDLSHSSLSAGDEKKATAALAAYVAQKPAMRQYAQLDAAFKENEAVRGEISGRLAVCDAQLNAIKALEDVEKAALEGVRAKADEETSDVPTLVAEKKECWDIMQAMRDKVTEVRTEFDARWREWAKLDRNFNAWQRWDRAQKYEEARKERAERTEEYKSAEVTNKGEEYDSQVYTCDQTLAYLRKFVAAAVVEKADAAPVAAPEGMTLFKKRDVEEDIKMTVAPKKKGNAPKGLAAQQAAAAAAKALEEGSSSKSSAPAGPKVVKMNNNLETLRTFLTLQIEAPVTSADVPATILKVEAKKQHYLDLNKKAREAPAPKPTPAAPVTAAAAAEEEEAPGGEDGEEEEEDKAAAPAEVAAAAEEEEAGAAVAADASDAGDGDEAEEAVGVALKVDADETVSLELKLSA